MKRTIVFFAASAVLGAALLAWPRTGPRASGRLTSDVYVWQRAWTEQTCQAVTNHAPAFATLVVLKAEVAWRNSQPHLVRVALDYPALLQSGRPVGLALRMGSFAGPFRSDDTRACWLTELAAELLNEAATNRLPVAELQLDFDCAESKLDGYRLWVEAIRRRVAPVPVTITALPSWLKRPACKRLIAAADGWVLQVHSLERPRDVQAAFTLCDPQAARRAVERAGKLGRPFRVALPTYGYSVAFDGKGRFSGLSAEGPARAWPEGTQLREVRAEPSEIAALVQGWMADRPETLTGLIWYRLPVQGDTLNWRWPTLASVMAGTIPQAKVRVEARRPQPKLFEVDVVNDGEADHASPLRVALRWNSARLVAADSLQGFELKEDGAANVNFSSRPGLTRLAAGERRTIGWIRLNQDSEVELELNSHN